MESLRKGPLRTNLSRKNSSPVQSRTRTISDNSTRPNYNIRKTSTEYKDRGLIVPSTNVTFNCNKQQSNYYPLSSPVAVKAMQLMSPYQHRQDMHYEPMIAKPNQLYNEVEGQKNVMNNFSFSKQEGMYNEYYAPPLNIKTAINPLDQDCSQSNLDLKNMNMYNRTYIPSPSPPPPQSPLDNIIPTNFNGNNLKIIFIDIGVSIIIWLYICIFVVTFSQYFSRESHGI